jgi:hypothetical protein
MPGPVFGIIVDRLATDVPVTGDADIGGLVQIAELGQSRYRDTGLKGGFDLWERLVRRAEGLTTDPQLHQRLAEVRGAIDNAYTDLYLSQENRV